MKKLSSQGITIDPPSSGFSEGKLKDNPGDDTGSGAVVATVNDLVYAFFAPIKKYLGGVSDTEESENDSDMINTINYAAGLKNAEVDDYDTGVTYNEDDNVFYLGVQFVSMINGNLNQDPFTYPEKWRPADDRNWLLARFADGKAVDSGFAPVHNYRDSAYRQYFGMGVHNFGGYSGSGGSGIDKEFTGVHLDGTVITGDATLVALFDVGGANEYPFLDIIAPDVAGIRTLRDYRGTVRAYIDAVSGLRGDIGERQEDALQGHYHDIQTAAGTVGFLTNAGSGTAPTCLSFGSSNTYALSKNIYSSDGTNGTPRIDLETRMKNFADGLPFCVVMNDA